MRRAVSALAASMLALAVLAPRTAAVAQQVHAVPYAALPGWREDDHLAAYSAFRRSCRPVRRRAAVGLAPPDRALARICREAVARPGLAADAARSFFERHFRPERLDEAGAPGFLTAYFEPEYEGSLTPNARFTTPLLARPRDLVDAPRGKTAFSRCRVFPQNRTAAALTRGGCAPYPDRAGIETGALGDRARPLVYLDPVEAFVVHVQGSARIRLPDGRVRRVGFAGRNGWPYTSIGRVLSVREGIPPAELGLKGLMAWLRAHPETAAATMRLNESYIFFRNLGDGRGDASDGPIGAAGVALTPGRSLAVDPRVWRYGAPIWLEGELPRPEGGTTPLRRLVVAQDTGAAIVGAARGDLFLGTGAEAGERAGPVRQAMRFVALRPRATERDLRHPRRRPR